MAEAFKHEQWMKFLEEYRKQSSEHGDVAVYDFKALVSDMKSYYDWSWVEYNVPAEEVPTEGDPDWPEGERCG